MLDGRLDDYATDSQREALAAVRAHGGYRPASRAIGVSESTLRSRVNSVRSAAARKGFAPEHDMHRTVPDGYHVKGTSTLYDEHGLPRLQWVKSSIDHERQWELAQEAVSALAKDLPALPRIEAPSHHDADLMAVIPVADSHIGSYVYGPECNGQNYNSDEAIRRLCGAVDYLVSRQPAGESCLLVNLGDALHADNVDGKTERSGHILHLDTRMSRVIEMAMMGWKQCIVSALRRYQHVHMINVSGNHDEVLGMALRVSFGMLFADNPRVTIHPSPADRQYFQHGETLIGCVHGHQTKDTQLPSLMAAERPKQWGETKHRYWFRGHHHHDRRVEYTGCIVEQVRTLAAADKYAVSNGFLSGNDMKSILMHKKYGEVSRTTCALEMLDTAA